MFQVCKKIYFFFLKILSYFLFISVLNNFFKIWTKNKNTCGVIVISLTEQIGDIIASEPISRYFKHNFNDKIVWVVNRKYSDLVKHNPNIDHLICVDSMSEWTYLKRFLNLFKIKIVDLHVDQNRCNKYFLTINNPIPAGISIYNYYNFGNLLAVFCLNANIPILNDTPIFYFPLDYQISDENKVQFQNYVCIHTVSRECSRNWEIEKWNALIDAYPSIMFVELGLSSNLASKTNCYNKHCGCISFFDSAYILKNAQFFISIDSSFAHIANAFNTPSLILLGKYSHFKSYMPYSGNFELTENADLIHYERPASEIPLELVINRLSKKNIFKS
jgi:ADP-heptose:LPS heptosyltransferase